MKSLLLIILGLAVLKAADTALIRTFRIPVSFNGQVHEGEVQKFEDGPNTCYIAVGSVGNASVAISCVKR